MPEEVRDRWGKYVDELDQQLQQDVPGEQPLDQTVADLLNDPLGSDADKSLGERLSGEIRDHFTEKADRQNDSGFGLLDEQVDRLDQGVRGVTDRIESGLNQGMGTIDDGINSVNDGIHSVSDGIHSMQNEVDSRVQQGLDALDLSHWLSEPEGTSRLVALPGYRVNGDEVLKIRQGTPDRYGSAVDGLYRIGSDGTVDLGSHGKVAVAGRTLRDVETQIERQLGGSDVSLGVAAAEREVYYVIAGEPGQGGGAWRVRSTGNETIEDAIRSAGTAPRTIEKIWMVHPSPGGVGTGVPVPVQWDAARQQASPNYRITPGDAVFVTEKNSPASASVDNWVGAWRQWLRR
jgi:hypothetical protein